MKQPVKNVVLVHGAFADGSGWEGVANILKKDGYTVAVVQHPETSYAEDVKFTKAVIDRQSGPVVLCGPKLRRGRYHGSRQSSEGRGACLHCSISN